MTVLRKTCARVTCINKLNITKKIAFLVSVPHSWWLRVGTISRSRLSSGCLGICRNRHNKL